jgi:hypothetical protein
MNAHTPGPWNDGLHHQGHLAIQSDSGRLVAFCGAISRNDGQLENLANARLIAAAPDLLHALQMIDSNAAESAKWIRRVARDAIAKATGETA